MKIQDLGYNIDEVVIQRHEESIPEISGHLRLRILYTDDEPLKIFTTWDDEILDSADF